MPAEIKMPPTEFKAIWARADSKESAFYQSHFDGLRQMPGVQTPVEADPKREFLCYRQPVTRNGELVGTQDATGETASTKRGFAEVWKKECFGWGYKGKTTAIFMFCLVILLGCTPGGARNDAVSHFQANQIAIEELAAYFRAHPGIDYVEFNEWGQVDLWILDKEDFDRKTSLHGSSTSYSILP